MDTPWCGAKSGSIPTILEYSRFTRILVASIQSISILPSDAVLLVLLSWMPWVFWYSDFGHLSRWWQCSRALFYFKISKEQIQRHHPRCVTYGLIPNKKKKHTQKPPPCVGLETTMNHYHIYLRLQCSSSEHSGVALGAWLSYFGALGAGEGS